MNFLSILSTLVHLIPFVCTLKLKMKRLEMKLTEKFGKRLKELRKKAGLSQQNLAELVGMESSNNISKLEAGEQLPKKENLEQICNALKIEVKELFDFGHIKTREELISDLNETIKKTSLKDLQYFKKIIDAYLETK